MTTEQRPAPAGDSVPVNPYQQLTNAYYAPGGGGGGGVEWAPPPTRSWAGPIAVGVVAVVMLGFGVAFGANEFAKHELCDDINAASAAASAPVAGTPAVQANTTTTGKATGATATQTQTAAQMHDEIDVTRTYAKLLVLDGELQDAVLDLLADADSAVRLGEEFKNLSPEERMDNAPRVAELSANLQTHAAAVRTACGAV